MLNINIETTPDYILVTLVGHLDGSQAGVVSQKISLALYPSPEEDEITTNLIFDIGGLSYMSSGGLGTLLAFHRKITKSGHKMIVCNPTTMVSTLLTTTGMYGVFQVQPSVDSAIKTLLS